MDHDMKQNEKRRMDHIMRHNEKTKDEQLYFTNLSGVARAVKVMYRDRSRRPNTVSRTKHKDDCMPRETHTQSLLHKMAHPLRFRVAA
jgi:hypothetical protein